MTNYDNDIKARDKSVYYMFVKANMYNQNHRRNQITDELYHTVAYIDVGGCSQINYLIHKKSHFDPG